MYARLFTRITLTLLVIASGLLAAGCSSTSPDEPQRFTGQSEHRTPHYEAHSKGQAWGRIVYR